MTAAVGRLRGDLGDLAVIPAVWGAQWVFLAPLLLARRDVLAPPRHWGSVAAMALFESVGFVLYSAATAFAPVAVVSPPASLSTLFTVLFASVVLREPIGLARWALVGCVVAGVGMLGG
jgi:drug/metabolite transporter (DMT)-like permease